MPGLDPAIHQQEKGGEGRLFYSFAYILSNFIYNCISTNLYS